MTVPTNTDIMLEKFSAMSKSLDDDIIAVRARRKEIQKDINDLTDKITKMQKVNDIMDKLIVIYTKSSGISRDNARQHFEKIITDALQFVTQSTDYEFIIQELKGRQKASYEFYIKSTVNGVECIQKPEDANGGGFVDIISCASKYAYLEIFNDPKIMSGTLLYDEPGKMISEQMSMKFAEYIKFLGSHYGRQTIMVTHNDNLANVADKTYLVQKDANGISKATVFNTAISHLDFSGTEALWQE